MKQVRRTLSLLMALLMIVSCFGGLSVFAEELEIEPEEVLVEEAPAGEAPTEEALAEEAPTEEAPVEEELNEEVPTEEEAVEEEAVEAEAENVLTDVELEVDNLQAPGDWNWGTVTVTPIPGAEQPVAGEAFNGALYTYKYDLPRGTHARAVFVVWPTGEPLYPWSAAAAPSGVSAECRDGKVIFHISENSMQEQYNFRVVVVCEDYYFWHDYDWHYIMSDTQTLNHIGTMEYSSEGYTGVYDGAEHGITVNVTKPAGATIKYGTSADRCNQSSSPTYTNGTHTVYYTITHKGYKTVTGSEVVKITAKDINSVDITVAAPADEVYNGRAHTPDVTVKDGEKKLTKDKDYTLSYKNNIEAGTATVTITGKGNYAGTKEVTFNILKAPINPVVQMDNWVYDTVPSTPRLVSGNPGNGSVTYEYKAADAADSTYSTTRPTAVGSYVVRATVAETKNYQSRVCTDTFSILPNNGIVATAEGYSGVYDGQAHGIAVNVTKPAGTTVKYGESAGACTEDSLTYTNVGKYPVHYTVTKDGYTPVSGMKYVEILAKGMDSEDISIEIKDADNQVYNGKAHTPEVVVEDDGTPLEKGKDYTVSYSNNVHAGTATVTITGIDNYKGTKDKTFTIKQKELTADVSAAGKDYDGTTYADITVTVNTGIEGEALVITGVTGAFADANVGDEKTVNVNSTGKDVSAASSAPLTRPADYKVTVPSTTKASILAKDIGDKDSGVEVGEILARVYNGQNQTPSVVVTDDGEPMGKDKDYTVSYTNNKHAGTATVTITGIDNYKGTKEVTFTILPRPVDAHVSAANKVYDGTKNATLTVTVDTGIAGETLTISGLKGTFASKNVGNDILVEIDSSKAVKNPGADTQANDYEVTYPTRTDADITAKTLTPSVIGAVKKVYDKGTSVTGATENTLGIKLTGIVDGDTVYATAQYAYADANVGTGKTVNASNLALAGSDAKNYVLGATSASGNVGIITKAGYSARVLIEDWTYGETPNAPYVTEGSNPGGATVIYEYKLKGADDSTYTTEVPTDAGEYTVRATIPETDSYEANSDTENFTIKKADSTATAPKAIKDLIYTGAAQTLATAGSAVGGTMYYSLDNNPDKSKWTTDLSSLKGTDAKTYTLWYYVKGDANHTDFQGGNITCGIGVKFPDYKAEGVETDYDGKGHSISVNVTAPAGATVEYKYGDGSYSTKNPEFVKAGTYVVTFRITKANYETVEETATVLIHKKSVKVQDGTITADDKVYDGNTNAVLHADDAVIDGLVAGDKVTVEVGGGWFDNKNVGDDKPVAIDLSKVKLVGDDADNYELAMNATQKEAKASITPKPIKIGGIEAKDKIYDGTTDAELDLSGLKIDGVVEGDDIEYFFYGEFEDPNVGKKTVHLGYEPEGADIGNYVISPKSQTTTTASIKAKSIVDPDDPTKPAEGITVEPLPIPDQTYTGEEIEPKVIIKDGDKTLEEGKDYTLEYKDNVNVGEATVIVHGKDNYEGDLELHFNIVPKEMTGGAEPIPDQKYTGKEIEPKPVIWDGDKKLKEGRDYEIVEYKDNVEIGEATVIVRFKGNYTGELTLHFNIVENSPKPPKPPKPEKPAAPKTGDSNMPVLWATLALSMGLGATAIVLKKKDN